METIIFDNTFRNSVFYYVCFNKNIKVPRTYRYFTFIGEVGNKPKNEKQKSTKNDVGVKTTAYDTKYQPRRRIREEERFSVSFNFEIPERMGTVEIEEEEEAVAIAALGSLFKLTEVHLW